MRNTWKKSIPGILAAAFLVVAVIGICYRARREGMATNASASQCVLQGDLGSGIQGGPGPNACASDATLDPGDSCSVQCSPGYTSRGGTTEYKCQKDGQLAPATLRCRQTTCALPPVFGQGRTWGGSEPCEEGGHLVAGKTCTIKCAQGYRATGGSPLYKCGKNGELEDSDLKCTPNTCRLPSSFEGRQVEGGNKPCQPGKDMAAGEFCTVACAPGFKAVSGSPDYTCDPDGGLTPPSLQCEPISCSIPAGFGPGVAGRGEDPCVPGAILRAGKNCTVGCAPGYGVIGEIDGPGGESDTRAFRCSEAGFLTEPDIKCKKNMVLAYNSAWAMDLGGSRN